MCFDDARFAQYPLDASNPCGTVAEFVGGASEASGAWGLTHGPHPLADSLRSDSGRFVPDPPASLQNKSFCTSQNTFWAAIT